MGGEHGEDRAALGVGGNVKGHGSLPVTEGTVHRRPVGIVAGSPDEDAKRLRRGLERYDPPPVPEGTHRGHVLTGVGTDIENHIDPVTVQKVDSTTEDVVRRERPDQVESNPLKGVSSGNLRTGNETQGESGTLSRPRDTEARPSASWR